MSTKQPRFLITGGAGFVGGSLARFLRRKDCEVRTLDLQPIPVLKEVVPGPHFQGDVRERRLLRTALPGVDIVVHAAAALPLWEREQIDSINVEGTAHLLEVCVETGIRRVVNLSTTAVYGVPDREGLQECDPLLGGDPYSRSKIRAEVIANRYRDRLCVTQLRAKLVTGPGRPGFFSVVFDWVRRGKNVPLIGSGANVYQMLHIEDLNQAIWQSATAPEEVANDTYNIAAGRFGTVREDMEALLEQAGHGGQVIGLPEQPLMWVLHLLDKMKISPLSRDIIQAAGKRSSVSIEKASRNLGWTPAFSNSEALIDAYQWYLQNPQAAQDSPGVTHTAPLRQGLLALIRECF